MRESYRGRRGEQQYDRVWLLLLLLLLLLRGDKGAADTLEPRRPSRVYWYLNTKMERRKGGTGRKSGSGRENRGRGQ